MLRTATTSSQQPAERMVPVRPGPKPRVSKELAIEIGTVYA